VLLWIRIHFFRIRILILIFWPGRNFLKWCLLLLSYMFWNLYDREKKVFQLKNVRFFSLPSVRSAIFRQNFLFYNSVWIRIRTFFGFGSSQTIRIISDSEPQHFWPIPWLFNTFNLILMFKILLVGTGTYRTVPVVHALTSKVKLSNVHVIVNLICFLSTGKLLIVTLKNC
jgi:hypothetical protein